MQQRSEWRSSVLLRHSFIYGSNWLRTDRPTSVRQFRSHTADLEVEPERDLCAMHYDPIEKVGGMVIVV
jgi:hypothetical protein